MYTRSEMREMTNEELNVIAMEKNKRNRPTPEAKYAQELIWGKRIKVRETFIDEYEGWIDPYDEDFQDYLDFVDAMDFIGQEECIVARAYTYSFREMEKILRKNGFAYIRTKGSHKIYKNGTCTAVVPIHLKKMLALRIIKQCSLVI